MREWWRGFSLWLAVGFRAAPALTVAAVGLGLARGAYPPVQAYALKLIVDGLTEHARNPMVAGVVLAAAAYTVHYLLISVDVPLATTVSDKAAAYLQTSLIRVTASIPSLTHHERPEYADRIELLRRNARQMSFNVPQLLALVTAGANLAGIIALLAAIDPVLLLLLVPAAARVGTRFIDSKLRWIANRDTATATRTARSLQAVAKAPHNGLELRVFGLRNPLLRRIDDTLADAERRQTKAAWRGARYEIASRVLFGLGYAAAVAYVAVEVRHGRLSPGSLALIVLLGSRIEQATAGVASATNRTGQTIRLFTQYAWLRDHAARESWSTSTGAAPTRLHDGIAVRGVAFCYAGSTRPVLSGIDLRIPAGATIALVGENGAGKSTLVKLLARLYDPTDGSIMVDGVDLRYIDPRSWRSRVSAGFQDFVKFEFTARDSVGVGDVPDIDKPAAVSAAVERGDAGSVVDHLPNGIDTQLGKRFTGGVDLSGGQWQRIALARAFMRERPLLLLLDEPTAALDPEAEHRLYNQFTTASRATAAVGGITVLVSHRFSTVRTADLIVVMDHGRIIETGTHGELMAADGRYAELFNLQARSYR
jgi:ATP-binding cassette subfamily B protein